MKLILCSEGFYTEEIILKCEELVGKKRNSINIAIVNEGYAVEHEDNLRWVLDNLNTVRDNFGGNLELVNLLALDIKTVEERIKLHDVIFVVGGDTDYLMSVYNKTGFSKLLPKLLKSKVYVGSSAGSMVLGKRLSRDAYAKVYGFSGDYGIIKYLEIVNFVFMPHLENSHFPNRKENLIEAVKKYSGKIYGLRDDSAVVVEGENMYTMGSEPLVLNKKS